MQLTKIHRERAVDAVYHALRQAIVSNGLKPGQRLNVDELAEGLGVSLTPVRGAVQRLASEGLVEIRPRSGTYVMSLDAVDVEETYRVYTALECQAAEEAVGRLTPKDLRVLRDHLKAARRTPRAEQDCAAYRQNLTAFHQTIIDASGNRRLREIAAGLQAHLNIAHMHSRGDDLTPRTETIYADHLAIVEALELADAVKAVAAIRQQKEHSRQALLDSIFEDREPTEAQAGSA